MSSDCWPPIAIAAQEITNARGVKMVPVPHHRSPGPSAVLPKGPGKLGSKVQLARDVVSIAPFSPAQRN
jgi:hypothetical protein